MTEIRTLYKQVDVWISAALACYGFRRSDLDSRVLKKATISGHELLKAGKPAEARSKIYGIIEREYQRSIWPTLVKAP